MSQGGEVAMTENGSEQEDMKTLRAEQAVFGEDFSDQDIQRHVFVADADGVVMQQHLVDETRYIYDKLVKAKTTLQTVNGQWCQVVSDTLEELGDRRGSPYPDLDSLPWFYDQALHWKEVVDKRLGPSTDHLAAQFLLVHVQNSMATDCALAASKASRPLSRAIDDLLATRLFEHSHETEQILHGGPQLRFDKALWMSTATLNDRLIKSLHALNSRLHRYHLETAEARNALENAEHLLSNECPFRHSMGREAVEMFIGSLEKDALDDSSEADAMSKEQCERKWATLSAVMLFANNNKILHGMRQASAVCDGVRRMLPHFFKTGDIGTEIANQKDQEATLQQQSDTAFAREAVNGPGQQPEPQENQNDALHEDVNMPDADETEKVASGGETPIDENMGVPDTPSGATLGATSWSTIAWDDARIQGSDIKFVAQWLRKQADDWPDALDYHQLWERVLYISETLRLYSESIFDDVDDTVDTILEGDDTAIVANGFCAAVNDLGRRPEIPPDFRSQFFEEDENDPDQYNEMSVRDVLEHLDDLNAWPESLKFDLGKLVENARANEARLDD